MKTSPADGEKRKMNAQEKRAAAFEEFDLPLALLRAGYHSCVFCLHLHTEKCSRCNVITPRWELDEQKEALHGKAAEAGAELLDLGHKHP